MTHRPIHVAIAAFACLALSIFGDAPAQATDAPKCTGVSVGQVSCFAPKLCECIYDRGGTITGTPAGYHWDCGNLRPNCGEDTSNPATSNEFKGPYPLAIGIDRSSQDVEIR